MRIAKIQIKGFRNFNDEEIVFQPKTLIIGENDVGKTNLLYALRIMFDKSISEQDLELTDNDYNVYSGTDQVEITVTVADVTEDCLLSEFGGAVKDGVVLIRYAKSKNTPYEISIGFNEDNLLATSTRRYIKRLNMQYVDSNRDLFLFLKRERTQILRLSKERLDIIKAKEDEEKTAEIQSKLNDINDKVNSLHYVSSALEKVNAELLELSVHNEDQTVRFTAGESEAGKLLNSLTLSYSSNGNMLTIGGDGRNNQIFLATWIAKQSIQKDVDHVTFYAIEEPEAHLHPHQQRKLSEYIQKSFDGQVLVTTHSPHIASKLDPQSIIRLYTKQKYTYAACGGCNTMLKTVFDDFGYRLNAISAETFFSDGVLLVEGTSEVLFYRALAKEVGIDLDRYNISILSVEGIGFQPYVAICNTLNIPWVLRTDNDIFSKPTNKPTKNYYAGVSRIMGIVEQIGDGGCGLIQYWEMHKAENDWDYQTKPPATANTLNKYIRAQAEQIGIFLSDVDLETDLANSPLKSTLLKHYKKNTTRTLIEAMKKKKAQCMFDFLSKNYTSLNVLIDDDLLSPINKIKHIIEERIHPNNGQNTDSRAGRST